MIPRVSRTFAQSVDFGLEQIAKVPVFLCAFDCTADTILVEDVNENQACLIHLIYTLNGEKDLTPNILLQKHTYTNNIYTYNKYPSDMWVITWLPYVFFFLRDPTAWLSA